MRFLFLFVLTALLGISCKKEISAPKVANDSIVVPKYVDSTYLDSILSNSKQRSSLIVCKIECSPYNSPSNCAVRADGCATFPVEYCFWQMNIRNNGKPADIIYKTAVGSNFYSQTRFKYSGTYSYLYDYFLDQNPVLNFAHAAIPDGYDHYGMVTGFELFITKNETWGIGLGLKKTRIEGYILNGSAQDLSSLRVDFYDKDNNRLKYVHISDGNGPSNCPRQKMKPFVMEYLDRLGDKMVDRLEYVRVP